MQGLHDSHGYRPSPAEDGKSSRAAHQGTQEVAQTVVKGLDKLGLQDVAILVC